MSSVATSDVSLDPSEVYESSNNSWESTTPYGDIRCQKFICADCHCRGYPDCGDEELCEGCRLGVGDHRAADDIWHPLPNPLYDPSVCHNLDTPMQHYQRYVQEWDSRVSPSAGATSDARHARIMRRLRKQHGFPERLADLHAAGERVFGERQLPTMAAGRRARALARALTDRAYAPGGVGYRAAAQDYAHRAAPLIDLTRNLTASASASPSIRRGSSSSVESVSAGGSGSGPSGGSGSESGSGSGSYFGTGSSASGREAKRPRRGPSGNPLVINLTLGSSSSSSRGGSRR